jgi:magnesium transporter
MTPPPSGLANAAGAQGQEMVAAPTIGQISPTRCQARTRLYRGGKLELEGFPVADISEYLADESVTIWLDLRAPDRDDLAVLSEEFGLHPLAVEAALRQRSKLDRYRLFLTAYGARLDTGSGELATVEIAAFITSQALITVRQDDGLDIDAAVERWDESPDLAKFGVGYLLYGLLDYVVDGQLEAINPMSEIVSELTRRDLRIAGDELMPYYQAVNDQILRAAEWTDGLRDLATSILETNLTIQGNRMNIITKKVTGWAAIIAVPAFIASFFGMNVPYPGFGEKAGLAASIATIALAGLLPYLIFKRKDWL